MSLLGIDVGTTGCKVIAFDENGNELARSYAEYPLNHPRPGWVEISPQVIWNKVSAAMREVNARVRKNPAKALSISCQGEAVLPLDSSGRELHDFIITFDNRTQPQCDWWRERVGEKEIFRITGMPLHPMYSLNKAMWLKENRKDLFRRTWKFLCVEDYLIFRLTGAAVTDHSLAARTMALDVVRRDWSDVMLRHAGIDRNLLPSLFPSGTAVDVVRRSIVEETGLPEGTVVATGGHDQPCGALGAGIVDPGSAMNATGTSDVLCPVFAEPRLDAAMLESNYCCYPHACADLYCSIAFNLSGGLLLRWFRDVLCHEEVEKAARNGRDPYDVILSEMADEQTEIFILPHFVGSGTPHLDPRSRGAILGLTLETGKPHLIRALIDSINYEMKLNIDGMARTGMEIRELRAIGGGAKSRRWLQMKADAFGLPVVCPKTQEAASLGTAILAAHAIGLFPSARDGARKLVKTARTYEPDQKEHERYREKYGNYLRIYGMLKDFNHSLGGRADGS